MPHKALLLLIIALVLPAAAFLFRKPQGNFKQPKHAEGIVVADHARHDLPPVRLNERVIDLMSGSHFDNLLQDTPDELRPPSVILFHGFETCPNAGKDLDFIRIAETKLPSRERLLIAAYDMDANPKRAWFRFTPEMDLPKRFNVKECGAVVFVPRGKECNGFTEWCSKPTQDPRVTHVGCENFIDKCASKILHWDRKTPLVEWISRLVEKEGEPEISPVFGSYADQRRWIMERDDTTTDNELRDYYLVEAFPAFTKTGFLAMPIPDNMNQWFLDFWNRRKHARVTETWHSGSTQMSFHEEPTTFVSMDQESRMRDKLANEVIKPIVEKWSGISPLELTSFYGIREYKKNWLRGHIDRIDTHVLSVTFSLGKLNASNIDQILSEAEAGKLPKWPLEVVAFDGEIYRHEHPAGTMILYESSKLIHGRPYHNEGAPHLGAFCHFKPVNMDKGDAQKWDDIARDARANQNRNSFRGAHKSMPVVEPKHPVFSKMRYGDHTGFRKTGEPEPETEDEEESYSVSFQNDYSAPLDVHWVGPSGDLVLQGTVGVGSKFQVNTFIGHRFVWTEENSNKRMPKGAFEIEAGSRVYRYGGGNAYAQKAR